MRHCAMGSAFARWIWRVVLPAAVSFCLAVSGRSELTATPSLPSRRTWWRMSIWVWRSSGTLSGSEYGLPLESVRGKHEPWFPHVLENTTTLD